MKVKVKMYPETIYVASICAILVLAGLVWQISSDWVNLHTIDSLSLIKDLSLLVLITIVYCTSDYDAVIQDDKVTSHRFRKKLCTVDLKKPVYYCYRKDSTGYGSMIYYVSNFPFHYQNAMYGAVAFIHIYDKQNVIAIRENKEVRKVLSRDQWISMEDYHKDHLYLDMDTKPLHRPGKYPCERMLYALYARMLLIIGLVITFFAVHAAFIVILMIPTIIMQICFVVSDYRIYLKLSVCDDFFETKLFGKTRCRIYRNSRIYYKIVQSGVNTYFAETFVLISNEPFYFSDDDTALESFEDKKIIAIPYVPMFLKYLDFERWTEV